MTAAGESLIELLHSSDPDTHRIIDTFVSRFNAAYAIPGTDRWDITKEDWQRYEFLGDRVLSLIVAQSLFTQKNGVLDEGAMTKALSRIVSNRALDRIAARLGPSFLRLIPPAIGEQGTYGARITGGAFEAFIGALYCEVGLDDVAFFVNTIMSDALAGESPEENAIGTLQELFQKRFQVMPTYRKTRRTGPEHEPVFTYEVLFGKRVLGEGSGRTIREAQQAAAKQALEQLYRNL